MFRGLTVQKIILFIIYIEIMSLASSVGEFQRRKKKRNENVTQKKGGILLYIITNANACTAARQTATSSLHLLLSPRLVVRAAVRGVVF